MTKKYKRDRRERWDDSWERPGEAQQAALQMAKEKPTRFTGEDPASIAYWIAHAQRGRIYGQALKWSRKPPPIAEPARSAWKLACSLIMRILDTKYAPSFGCWWPLQKLWPESPQRVKVLWRLMDFGCMLHQAGQAGIVAEQEIGMGFWAFLDIVCGFGWEERFGEYAERIATKEVAHGQTQKEGPGNGAEPGGPGGA